jgi:diphosphate--fructose-6-phosphate 1-phosphotransferase
MFKKQPSFSVRGVTRGADGSRASAGEVPIERDIQLDRQKVPTSVPKVLRHNNFTIKEGGPTSAVADVEKIKQLFPNTFGQPIAEFKLEGAQPKSFPPMNVGVVLSGGQAAGGHNCICGIFDYLSQYAPGSKVYGFLGGPKAICDSKVRLLDKEYVDQYRNMGGFDMLGSGRDKIETPEQFEAARGTARSLDLDGIVVIGGDDSNTNAAVLGEDFRSYDLKTRVIGLPKTIDGDLKNEHVLTSFGFDTAAKVYAECVGNIQVDTVSTSKYYHFIRLMGREASHLTLEVAMQCQPNLTLISEEIRANQTSLEAIVSSVADLVVEREAKGLYHGVVLLPEGLIDFIPEFKPLIAEINEVLAKNVEADKVVDHLSDATRKTMLMLDKSIQNQLLLDRDPHGNVQVAKIESERLLGLSVQMELARRAQAGQYAGKFEAQYHYFGYEGRCALPSEFDCQYCYALGLTAGALLANGKTCMIASVQNLLRPVEEWSVAGVPLTAMLNIERRKGKDKPVIKKALTELDGAPFKYFAARRDSWRLQDMYRIPGPLQFTGQVSSVVPATLELEQGREAPQLGDLVGERRAWQTPLPEVLRTQWLGLKAAERPRVAPPVEAMLPKTSPLRTVHVTDSTTPSPCTTPLKIGVVFSGRQCPGAHNVVGGLFRYLQQRAPGSTLVGFKGGTDGLLSGTTIEVTEELCNKYNSQGGMSMLGRTRDVLKPGQVETVSQVCYRLGLHGLVYVGGCTSSTIAMNLAEAFVTRGHPTRVIAVPAVIDGDMVGHYLESTVGFETATLCYSQLVGNLCTDAASAMKYYYFVRVMGRSASHTALECALQTRPTMCIVSEEVAARGMSLHDVVTQIADVVERRAVEKSLNYGLILVPEGLVESIAELRLLLKELATKSQQVDKLTPWARAVLDSLPASIQAQMKLAPEESSGSAQVNNIETERLLAELVGEEMQRRKAEAGSRYNKSFAPVCFYLGYQARSSLPTPFDCALGTTLGYTAGLLIKEGLTGYAATVSEVCKPQAKWSVGGVPLCAFARPTPEGKVVIQPNLVDLNGETFREFSEQRQQWEIMDSFINPGPIQYDMMTRPKTVIADIAYMGALRQQVLQMCDQIKASCGVGANADYLHTAKESLSSLQRVLAIVSKYDVFAEAQKLQESVVTRHEPLTNLYASNKNPRAAAFTEDLDETRNPRVAWGVQESNSPAEKKPRND